MIHWSDFEPFILQTAIGGHSALDFPRLKIRTRDQACAFLKAYGFDVSDEADLNRLWSYHHRAVTYLQSQLLLPEENMPLRLAEADMLHDVTDLLLLASAEDEAAGDVDLRRWACAILRVMHVIIHLNNDLFTAFSDEIQSQILRPFQEVIRTDENGRIYLGRDDSTDRIQLEKFDVKPFKTSNSSITKLLAKPEAVAFGLLDKMGLRFVTSTMFDSFRVLAWLFRNNVVSFPHLIPDQSSNTLYPLNLFLEVANETANELRERNGSLTEISSREMDLRLQDRLEKSQGRLDYRERSNAFTSPEYRFIKFIVRRLVRANAAISDRPFAFFYPHEVQIMDLATFEKNSSGPSSHSEYKSRQRARARERVFGLGLGRGGRGPSAKNNLR